MAARRLLFEEQYGIHIRAAEREERRREAQLASDYRASVARLKRDQQV